jgi:hypothetical protein
MRLKASHETSPNASGVTNSVASTRPNRSTTVSQTTDASSQCRAARSGKRSGVSVSASRGTGAEMAT